MKENLHIVLITVILFAAGLFTGVWTQRVKPVPPPPLPFMGEFGDGRSVGGAFPHGAPSSERAREMHQQMEAARPQMEAFRAKMEAIEKSFRSKLDAILKPDQKARLAQVFPQQGLPPKESGNPPSPKEGMRPGPGFMGLVIYKPVLARLTDELHLDAKQQAQAEEFLKQRRQEVLSLVDTTPPPSVTPPARPEDATPPRR